MATVLGCSTIDQIHHSCSKGPSAFMVILESSFIEWRMWLKEPLPRGQQTRVLTPPPGLCGSVAVPKGLTLSMP